MRSFRLHLILFKNRWKFICSFLALTVLNNEFLVYWWDSLSWPEPSCKESCLRLLVVSDPQILGSKYEPLSFIGYMDTDLYMKKSFSFISSHSQPDVIIFLGDLMDEGSTSNDEEYKAFKERFENIFNTSHLLNQPKVIYLPGDNDIGGEGSDRLTEAKINRFNSNFPSETQQNIRGIQFISVNRIVGDYNLPKISLVDKQLRVVLSHIPLTFVPGIFSKEVMTKLKPHLIFSAHDHRAALATTLLDEDRFQVSSSFAASASGFFRTHLNDEESVEIIWPTCSYRMGVAKAGYGFASISAEGEVEAGILWTHSRFFTLNLYLVVILASIIFYFTIPCCRLR